MRRSVFTSLMRKCKMDSERRREEIPLIDYRHLIDPLETPQKR